MTATPSQPADWFDEITEELAATRPDIEPTRMFGSNGLKVRDKTFAMVVDGHLVVKLPRERVDHLVTSGVGQRFDPGHGRLMKEWVVVETGDRATWRTLAEEALGFVAASTR